MNENTIQLLAILSAAISFIGYIPYIRGMRAGTILPHRVSWFLWAALQGILLTQHILNGSTSVLWLSGVTFVMTLLIAIMSVKQGFGGFNRRGVSAIIVSALAVSLAFSVQDPATRLILMLVPNSAAVVLTWYKITQRPFTESMPTWLLSSVSGGLSYVAAINQPAVAQIYPLYVLVAAGLTVAVMVTVRNKARLLAVRIIR